MDTISYAFIPDEMSEFWFKLHSIWNEKNE